MGRYAESLRQVPVFRGLDARALEELEGRLIPRQFGKDAMLVRQGDEGDALHVVVSGRAKAVLAGEGGRDLTLHIFGPGEFFGEMALIDDEPRSATVVALCETTTLVLSRAAFLEHLRVFPETAMAMLRQLVARLRNADEVIGSLAHMDVHGRVLRVLRDLAEREEQGAGTYIRLTNRPTHQELASMIGTSRETVSRTLTEMARRGEVELEGRSLALRADLLA